MKIFLFFFMLIGFPPITHANTLDTLTTCITSLRHHEVLFNKAGFIFNPDYFDAIEGTALSKSSDHAFSNYQRQANDLPPGDQIGIAQCYKLGVSPQDLEIIRSRLNNGISDNPKTVFERCVVGLNLTIGAVSHNLGSEVAAERTYAKDYLIGAVHESLIRLFPGYNVTINDLAKTTEGLSLARLTDLQTGVLTEKAMMTMYKEDLSQCSKFGIDYREFQKGLQ